MLPLPSTVLMLCFLLRSAHVVSSAAASDGDSSLLELHVGLNLSMSANSTSMFNYAITAYGNSAYFLPFLSSSGFNSTNSSESLGFSLGFLFSASDDHSNIYLAVCGGLSGNYSPLNGWVLLRGSDDGNVANMSSTPISPNGFVVPVWIANLDNPLRSVKSSLVVVGGSDVGAGGSSSSNELQLRDHDGRVVWKVRNVNRMQMQNTGNLVIYESMNTTNVVWQSAAQPTDTLVQGQKLTVGKQLTSNDSSYLARMEKGGLVLYDNHAQFVEQPSPYWVIPILFNTRASNVFDLNTLVLSPPCNNPNDADYGTVTNFASLSFRGAGSCSNMTEINYLSQSNSIGSGWAFVRLETDGRLNGYSVDSGTISFFSLPQPNELATLASYAQGSNALPYSWWGQCDVPMACGPLGVCSQGAETLCACPVSPSGGVIFFTPIDNNNLSNGCKRATPLPTCSRGIEHVGTTSYVQLNQTASIFFFGGWAYTSPSSAPVEKCKESCSSNCSCQGFFYKASSSACFFITKEISLLNVTDNNGTYTNISTGAERVVEIFARNHVTYLKVTTPATTSSSNKHAMIAITALSVFLACLMLGLAVYLFRARKSKRARTREQVSQAEEEEELRDILPMLPSRFSYQDLHEATRAFTNLLGAGGCGSVYAGVLPDGRKIAVKVLVFGLLKGHAKQFLAEVATIGRTSHHNIVRLVGFCWEVSNRLLVYEYAERGSLDHWLFVKEGAAAESAPLLNWKTRYNVVLGIARGLSYLHEDCPQPILHFDIKPQNILLDGAFVAKLADFGMSRLMQRGVSEVVTGVRGTPGYIAPEWLTLGTVSKKSDVYSMGMVMLEIVGGRRNVDLTLLDSVIDPEEWYFPSWAAKKCKQGLMMELIDKRLQTFDEEQAQRLIHTAFWCIHENPSMRPSAPTVVQWLEGSSPVKEPPSFIANANGKIYGMQT